MSELLQFMYQGVVNVKHTELTQFMKIAQALQIKGLATSSNQQHHHHSHHHGQKSPSSPLSSPLNSNSKSINNADNYPMNLIESKLNLYNSSPLAGQKRSSDFSSGGPSGESSYQKKHLKRAPDSVDNDISAESMENNSSDEVFLPPIPQISMVESSRFDLSNVKREAHESLNSPGGIRNLGPPFNFEYNRNIEYPNDIHMHNDLLKSSGSCGSGSTGGGSGNHMDIPTGESFTLLF